MLGVGVGAGEDGAQPGLVVGAVIGEGFAGPVAGDEDAAAGEAEGAALVDFAGTVSGYQAGFGLLGLYPVEQPVGAGGGAGQGGEFGVEPVEMGLLRRGVRVG